MPPDPGQSNASLLLRYAGLAFQFMVTIGLGIWLGTWLDRKFGFSFPWCAFSIPVILVIGMLVQIVRETGKKNRGQKK
ncbi:MAG TPA: AtpZ/AtpI family protein [Phnomibacter sp.]|nr:AtpZ/AtpI family protein [Phnomibacter sp.]